MSSPAAETRSPVRVRRADEQQRAAGLPLVYSSPGREAAGLLGDDALAEVVGACLERAGLLASVGSDVFVAVQGGEVVGVLVGRAPHTPSPPRSAHLSFLRDLLKRSGLLRWPRLLLAGLLRSRLDFPSPPRAYMVAEVHVRPARRGRGIGASLLREAEREARRRGLARMTLSTLMTNPARRLYEREGYRVVAEKTVPSYETFTGARGRFFMEKELEGVQGGA